MEINTQAPSPSEHSDLIGLRWFLDSGVFKSFVSDFNAQPDFRSTELKYYTLWLCKSFTVFFLVFRLSDVAL